MDACSYSRSAERHLQRNAVALTLVRKKQAGDNAAKKGTGQGQGGPASWRGSANFGGSRASVETVRLSSTVASTANGSEGGGGSGGVLSLSGSGKTHYDAGERLSPSGGKILEALINKIGGEAEARGIEEGFALGRRSSLGGKKGSFIMRVKQIGNGNIQGMEFVRTLTRKNKPAIESVNPTIGNPYAKHTREYRDEFCALIMGRRGEGAGGDHFGPCRQALERDPNDRSMMDLEAILDFARRCSLMMTECTPVERFVAMRCAKLLRLKVGATVNTSDARLYIAISGSIIGQRFGREVQYSSGDAFGRKTILNATRKVPHPQSPTPKP